jgi:flagellar protein FlaF
MHRQKYAEIVDDSPQVARGRERALLLNVVAKLDQAKRGGVASREAVEAIYFLRRVWSALLVDLSHEDNALPDTLRASLISIGLWINREADLVDAGKSSNFDGLIEINRMIADGLV